MYGAREQQIGMMPTAEDRRLAHVWFEGETRSRPKISEAGAKVDTRGSVAEERAFLRAEREVLAGGHSADEGVPEFLTWLLQRGGLDAEAYRGRSLERRLSACFRALRVTTEAEARALLERKPGLVGRALDAVLIGVTCFFRDEGVFECLREALSCRSQRLASGARVYSMGCSEGQELYTAGMVVGEMGALAGSELVGMDCRTAAIMRARAGWYKPVEVQQVPREMLERYFCAERGGFRVVPHLLERTNWRVGDLLSSGGPAGPWDVVLFRNAGMYLRAEAAAAVWKRLVGELRPGGLLVSGKAEQPPRNLPIKRVGPCVYLKTE